VPTFGFRLHRINRLLHSSRRIGEVGLVTGSQPHIESLISATAIDDIELFRVFMGFVPKGRGIRTRIESRQARVLTRCQIDAQ
jgi:hypothetical protein